MSGNSKNSTLFISLLKRLKATYRRAKIITLIVDNYIIRKIRETQPWLKENPKFRGIYQPVYSPWVNHVEQLWQAFHDTITRNHQCRSMWQLLKKVHHFMETVSLFPEANMGWQSVAVSGAAIWVRDNTAHMQMIFIAMFDRHYKVI